jgi:hypothetical protein
LYFVQVWVFNSSVSIDKKVVGGVFGTVFRAPLYPVEFAPTQWLAMDAMSSMPTARSDLYAGRFQFITVWSSADSNPCHQRQRWTPSRLAAM